MTSDDENTLAEILSKLEAAGSVGVITSGKAGGLEDVSRSKRLVFG
jgi:hypothetical protein